MRGSQPAADQLTVTVEGSDRALSEKAADGIYVRAAVARPNDSFKSSSRTAACMREHDLA